MVNNTIWESASRPLFVRSIWLETAKSARAPQRHFILDYETQRKLQEQRNFTYYSSNQSIRKIKESYRQTLSYDISEIERCRTSGSTPESIKDLLTVACSKLQLQPPVIATPIQKPKQPKRTGPRRLTKRNLEQLEAHSGQSNRNRKSINSPFIAGIEVPVVSKRLAERVLNWLDLAVKTVATGNNELDLEIPDNESPSAQRCATAKLLENGNCTKSQKQCAYKRWKKEEESRQKSTYTTNAAADAQQSQTEAVKCVSIVFERQYPNYTKTVPAIEIPGRAKNFINLERVNKSADIRRLMRPHFLESVAKSAYENLTPLDNEKRNSSSGKKSCSQQILQDTRKELHIFMPSLPDKAKDNSLELSCPSMFIDLASTMDSASGISMSAN